MDIDEADANDELAMVEYIDDIYKFYKLTEVIFLAECHLLIYVHIYVLSYCSLI